ncbi:MAG: excinuclease ABC subunit UvrA [Acidobacteria bacterium]|nr:excinuclease ABC subunit UvrA [Acidobacteriota bacterium]
MSAATPLARSAPNAGDSIIVRGARVHNLKGLCCHIPINGLTVITGVSGSGKSSLAFDTLYAEGQRRYVESLSAYARQFLERMEKPAVDEVIGISPAIAIRQKNTSRNPRSTVGTATEIYDFVRLAYARIGRTLCRQCGQQVRADSIDSVVETLLEVAGQRAYLLFPLQGSLFDLAADDIPGRDEAALAPVILENLKKQGFRRLFRNGDIVEVDDIPAASISAQSYSVLVDRLRIEASERQRLADSLELCYREGKGLAEVYFPDRSQLPAAFQARSAASPGGRGILLRFSERFECSRCGICYRLPEPRLFSFNNPYGACPMCQGFGNTVNLDMSRIVPDPALSISQEPIDPWRKPRYRNFQKKLKEFSLVKGIDIHTPYRDLPEAARRLIFEGEGKFPGIRGFFDYLETKKYKIHVRILISRYRGYTVCPECGGQRLRREALDVTLGGKRITEVTSMTIGAAAEFFQNLKLTPAENAVAQRVIREIRSRLDFLLRVGLDYLTLDRLTSTLSGGEAQRIQLATALGAALAGALYVLDEPSIGLHPRDTGRLVEILKNLRDAGNTVLVVEHDRDMIQSADYIIDIGPGAGESGGELICEGDYATLLANPRSLTARYLKSDLRVPTPIFRRHHSGQEIVVRGARANNLRNLDVRIPLKMLVCITGVSGSGKSTLVNDVLYAGLKKQRGEWKQPVGEHDELLGSRLVTEVLMVDQSPIGKTPRSNPVTYIKAFDDIRHLFASTREAAARNFSPGHFSFNVPGGRCETCEGSGTVTVEMQFLADVELICDDCKGMRYKPSVLEVLYRGKNIHEVLNLTVREAIAFFASHKHLSRRLRVLDEVGLGYLRLGQSSTTLSGGEAQRIKLASFLIQKSSKRPLFILDEPTTGLHFDDINKLLKAIDRLIKEGASVVVIEHNPEVIKCADWIIDLGPEGGERGGQIVAQGRPEDIVLNKCSYTGQHLKGYLDSSRARA